MWIYFSLGNSNNSCTWAKEQYCTFCTHLQSSGGKGTCQPRVVTPKLWFRLRGPSRRVPKKAFLSEAGIRSKYLIFSNVLSAGLKRILHPATSKKNWALIVTYFQYLTQAHFLTCCRLVISPLFQNNNE